jgi:hypothetical protein
LNPSYMKVILSQNYIEFSTNWVKLVTHINIGSSRHSCCADLVMSCKDGASVRPVRVHPRRWRAVMQWMSSQSPFWLPAPTFWRYSILLLSAIPHRWIFNGTANSKVTVRCRPPRANLIYKVWSIDRVEIILRLVNLSSMI